MAAATSTVALAPGLVAGSPAVEKNKDARAKTTPLGTGDASKKPAGLLD